MGLSLLSNALSRLQQLDERMIWRLPEKDSVVYLTFDDGPLPDVTPWVLDTLHHHGLRATFFCIGEHIVQNPALFERIKLEGHVVGNHTWSHPSGWTTKARSYYREVLQCEALTGTKLFRPPYGRVSNRQLNALHKRYSIVMWDVLSGDFEHGMTGDRCAHVVLRRVRPGSIIVFHDNVRSKACMMRALPLVISGLLQQGFTFRTLPPHPVKG
jgi:peptidoglycan-N-acetylglucosamine deacetylase